MNVKLPINLLPEIRYECWTYQRMAIIRAYPEFDAWFVHHLNSLCITSEYDCDFGWFGMKYNTISHYEDILEIEEKLYKDYDQFNIITEICRRVDEHIYTIIDVDHSKWQNDLKETFVAQLLVYGYDDEKQVFYAPSPIGGWHEEAVPWGNFIEAFQVRKAYTLEQKKATTTRQNPYPIIFLKPKLHVKPQVQLSRLYNDLKVAVNVADVAYHFDNKEIKDFYFYQGILGVCTGLSELMQRVYRGEFEIESLGYDHGFTSGYCKMLEYNTLFLACLKYVDEKFDLHISHEIYRDFEDVLVLNQKLRNSAIMYLFDRERPRLEIGLQYIRDIKSKERHVFLKLVELIEKYFIEG
jgi:hypothetical protein